MRQDECLCGFNAFPSYGVIHRKEMKVLDTGDPCREPDTYIADAVTTTLPLEL